MIFNIHGLDMAILGGADKQNCPPCVATHIEKIW